MSLSADLAALIRDKPITEDDRHIAALYLLDTVANAYAGRKSAAGQILLKWSQTQSHDIGRCALVIGSLAHILETDDLHRRSVTHPGCVVAPVILAISSEQESTGDAMLASLLHGYEAMCRVGMAVGKEHYKKWHNTATCGPFGSAIAAATMLKLDNAECVHALGNAGTQSAGLWEFLETGAMSKHLHAGRAAEAGVVASQLARNGFTGPTAILEGNRGFFAATCPDAMPEMLLANANNAWQLRLTSFKPWPSCRHTHAVIDAALELHSEIGVRPIRSVEVVTYPAALDLCDRPQPNTAYAAKFSLQHCVTIALTDGRVWFSSFDEDARLATAKLRSAVTVKSGEPFASAYPANWGASLNVTMTDGTIFRLSRSDSKGDPEHPLSSAEMISKASDLLNFAGLTPARTSVIIDSILNLPEVSATGTAMHGIVAELLHN